MLPRKDSVKLTLKPTLQHIVATLIGFFFLIVGTKHFIDPVWFEPIVPRILGRPRLWVYASGMFEVLFGFAILIPRWRSWAGPSMAILLIILYWANLNMWVNDIPINGQTYTGTWHLLRGLAQIVLIGITLWIGDWTLSSCANQEDEADPFDKLT